MSKIVADTSVIINGQLIAQIEAGSVRNSEIIIPQAVLDELQSQASSNKEQGFVGLEKNSKTQRIIWHSWFGNNSKRHASFY